jgi:hypothetical protein
MRQAPTSEVGQSLEKGDTMNIIVTVTIALKERRPLYGRVHTNLRSVHDRDLWPASRGTVQREAPELRAALVNEEADDKEVQHD